MTKLRVNSACEKQERLLNIEEAKDWNYYDPLALVVIENNLVHSYDELLRIASSDNLKNKEVLDVYLMITCTGG